MIEAMAGIDADHIHRAGEMLLDAAKKYAITCRHVTNKSRAAKIFAAELELKNAAVKYFDVVDGIYQRMAGAERLIDQGTGRGKARKR